MSVRIGVWSDSHGDRQSLDGLLAAMGGAYMSIGDIHMFSRDMVSGRGFIALATLIFGRWNAFGVLAASLLFGFFDGTSVALQAQFQAAPIMFFKMIPYVFTIVALIFFGSRSAGPKASGKPDYTIEFDEQDF